MTAEPLLVGADVGTTNIKVVAFDRSGQSVAHASTPTPTHYPRPGWAYYDPGELWGSFVMALRRVTDGLDDPRRIASIAVASMDEAAVPLDADGRPTTSLPGSTGAPNPRPSGWIAPLAAISSST